MKRCTRYGSCKCILNGLQMMELRRWKTKMNESSGNSRSSVEAKSMPDTVEVTDMVMTGAG